MSRVYSMRLGDTVLNREDEPRKPRLLSKSLIKSFHNKWNELRESVNLKG